MNIPACYILFTSSIRVTDRNYAKHAIAMLLVTLPCFQFGRRRSWRSILLGFESGRIRLRASLRILSIRAGLNHRYCLRLTANHTSLKNKQPVVEQEAWLFYGLQGRRHHMGLQLNFVRLIKNNVLGRVLCWASFIVATDWRPSQFRIFVFVYFSIENELGCFRPFLLFFRGRKLDLQLSPCAISCSAWSLPVNGKSRPIVWQTTATVKRSKGGWSIEQARRRTDLSKIRI